MAIAWSLSGREYADDMQHIHSAADLRAVCASVAMKIAGRGVADLAGDPDLGYRGSGPGGHLLEVYR
jgi:hypothetical protein